MPKKGKRSAQRHARDIQTPASDRESSSPKPESPPTGSAATGPATTGSATTDATQKQEKKAARFARSPTRKDDFAPGEISDNYESNTESDIDLENASVQDAPIEHRPDDVGRWVKDLIKAETAKISEQEIEDYFVHGGFSNPAFDDIFKGFFQRLNQEIRAANAKHGVTNLDNGLIKEDYYVHMCRSWQTAYLDAKAKQSTEDAWKAFNDTYNLIKEFNKRHYLPKAWNISEAMVAKEIGVENPQMRDYSDTASVSSVENQQAGTLAEPNYDSESEDEATGLNDLEDLDALEARTMNEQRRLTSGRVLYWWPKGTGSQTFVRYGDRHTPIYRIRAGSHQSYNRHEVECVLTTKTRGNAKLIRRRNGLEEEYWKYERKHIKSILGVGWKVYGDDENDLDPLALLQPEKGVVYPETRTLVKWKDDVLTLEGRAFMRRITSGSALDGDRVLYQKACEMENSYRKIHGLDEFESGFIEEERPRRTSRRQSDQEWSEDDTDSDSSIRLPSKRGRKKSESGRQKTPLSKQRNDEKIRSLERQLRQLKMDRPISPQRTNAKPRRRERRA